MNIASLVSTIMCGTPDRGVLCGFELKPYLFLPGMNFYSQSRIGVDVGQCE